MADKGPSNGLDKPARRQSALGKPRSLLDQRQNRLCDRRGLTRERNRQNSFKSSDAHDFLNKVRFILNIRPP